MQQVVAEGAQAMEPRPDVGQQLDLDRAVSDGHRAKIVAHQARGAARSRSPSARAGSIEAGSSRGTPDRGRVGRSIVATWAGAISLLPRAPWLDGGCATLDDRELVGIDRKPRALLTIGPGDTHLGARGRPEAHVQPAELAADVPTADRQLMPDGDVADPHVDPRADRVAVRARLLDLEHEPMAHRGRRVGRPCSDISPDDGIGSVVDLDEVEQAVEVEVGQRRAAPPIESQDAGPIGRLDEGPVRLAEEQVAWIALGVVGLRAHVPLRDEQVDEAVVVDIGELGVPRRRGQARVAGERPRRGHAATQRDIAEGGPAGPGGEGLELVVALAGEIDLGQPVPGQVLAGDPHPPDLQRWPPVGGGVESRRLARRHAPQLLRAIGVVLAIVRHAQVAPARAVPRAEEHGERAVTRARGSPSHRQIHLAWDAGACRRRR